MSKRTSVFGQAASSGNGRKLSRRLDLHEGWIGAVLPAESKVGSLEADTNRRPLVAFGLAGLVILGILVTRLFMLQIVQGSRNLSLAEGNRIRQRITRAPRGIIYDRKRKVLVRNEASFDVIAIPQQLPRSAETRQAVYARLSQLIGVSAAEIATKAEAKGLIQAQPQLVAANLDRDKALTLDESLRELAGFNLDVNPVRQYTDPGMSHILGYSGRISAGELKGSKDYAPIDYIGKVGLEQQYESVLRGANGSEQTEVDALGRPVKVLAAQPSVPGSSLVLSIDQDLQSHFSAAIAKEMERAGSTKGAGVALDPKTGEVLALVSLPGYDDNLFSKGISGKDYTKLAQDKAEPLFNKAVGGKYPSGSIIKPLVAAAALQEKVVTPQTTINDTGKLDVINQYTGQLDRTFYGYEHSGLGLVDVFSAIAKSSDIYFYTVGGGFEHFVGLGVERLVNYYHKFGLSLPTGIDLPDETAGQVPNPEFKQKLTKGKESWTTGDTYNISIGQGDLQVSPLQMAVATAAIANGGTIWKPHLVSAVLDDNGKVSREIKPEAVRQNIISPEVLSVVRQGMRQTITSGTACCLIEKEVPVAVAAKTGTAETDPEGKRKPHAWFSAFAPYEDPKIVMIALIENSGEGAEYAAPAVRETLSWYFKR